MNLRLEGHVGVTDVVKDFVFHVSHFRRGLGGSTAMIEKRASQQQWVLQQPNEHTLSGGSVHETARHFERRMIAKGSKVEKASWGGVVLCGGASSRMGRPKALLPWPDRKSGKIRTLVETVVETLAQVVSEVVVVSHPQLELPPLAAKVVTDREPGLGPLGGIREGLHARGCELIYVTSTDVPYLTPEFVRFILEQASQPLQAVAPKVDGFIQTLAAAYPQRLAAQADTLITAQRMRPLFLLQAEHYAELTAESLPELDSLRNLNSGRSYIDALRARVNPDDDAYRITVELLGVAQQKTGLGQVSLPFGTLGEVLGALQERCPQIDLPNAATADTGPFLVSLDGRQFLKDPELPVGPGDKLLIMDAAAGG